VCCAGGGGAIPGKEDPVAGCGGPLKSRVNSPGPGAAGAWAGVGIVGAVGGGGNEGGGAVACGGNGAAAGGGGAGGGANPLGCDAGGSLNMRVNSPGPDAGSAGP
jgi:hypothetical protein